MPTYTEWIMVNGHDIRIRVQVESGQWLQFFEFGTVKSPSSGPKGNQQVGLVLGLHSFLR